MSDLKPTKAELEVIRNLRSRAAMQIRDGKLEISMDFAEFVTAICHEELQIINMNNGKPIITVYHGLMVRHETTKAN